MSVSSEQLSGPVRRRLVLFVPGYEPLSAEAHQRRLWRTLEKTAKTWNLESASAIAATTSSTAAFSARLEGADWSVDSEIRVLAWDDLVKRGLAAPLPKRVLLGVLALFTLLLNGTLRRYAAAHWRFMCFAILPIVILFMALMFGLIAGLLVKAWAGLVLGGVVFCGLTILADRCIPLGLMLALWIFGRDLARESQPEVTARISSFADEIKRARQRRDVDEIVLIGHSLGAALLVAALAEVLSGQAEGEDGGPKIIFVGLGSCLLKIALMPEAAWLRSAIQRIALADGLEWQEFTSRRDVVSFHRADPVAILGLRGNGPRMESIHPRAMISDAEWRRMRHSVLRAHRVYLTGNSQRYFYDWGLMACGPASAAGAYPSRDRPAQVPL